MPRSTNQKLKLLCLCKILWERTDEDHPMTVPELIQALEEWDIKAERKSIYDDMEALRVFGLDVQNRKGKDPGWFLGERSFQLAELKLGPVLPLYLPEKEQRSDRQAGVPGQQLSGAAAPAAGLCGPTGQNHE